MVRTQIQLTETQAASLRSAAARKGISMAELIRQAIDATLAGKMERSEDELRQRAMAAAGVFHSGRKDVAERHDALLAEDFTP